jgi:hypothetical protein
VTGCMVLAWVVKKAGMGGCEARREGTRERGSEGAREAPGLVESWAGHEHESEKGYLLPFG